MIDFDDKKGIKSLFIRISLFFIFAIIIFLIANSTGSNYVLVEDHYLLEGKVVSKTVYQGLSYLILENKEKFIVPNSRNYDYEPHEFYDFIKKNDYLIKKEYSDTIYIIRENKDFYFIIGEFINR